MTTPPRSRSRGFTLMETLAAMVVMSIAIPPMLWALRESHLMRVAPVMTSKARWLATEKLEDVIADRHSTTRGWSYLVTGNYTAESPVTTDQAFDRTVTLTEYDADLTTPNTDGGYMVVDVQLDWTDAVGDAQSLTVSTVVTDYAE